MTVRRLFIAALLLAGGSSCGSQEDFDPAGQVGANPELPEPTQDLMPAMRIPQVVGWQANERPAVARGLRIEAMATGLGNPRNLLALPNGDVLVVESRKDDPEPVSRPKQPIVALLQSRSHGAGEGEETPSNRITLLRDADGNGQPEGRIVLVDGLNSPFGIVAANGYLYVANTDAVVRYRYNFGDTRVGPAELLTQLPAGTINHHWTKSMTLSPDGRLLYVGVGSNSNAMENGADAEMDRAAIWQVDAQTGAKRLFATGLRNPNGLTFYPGSDVLWAVINERDELGPDLVPDYLTSVRPGAFYGWPYSYYGQHVDPRVMPQRPDLVARAIPPDYALGSHVAPLGLAFAANGLPGYEGGAFVGEHGSWNRTAYAGYKVVFIPFANGRPSGMPRDVVTAFLNQDGQARGRPVGLAIDRTGALLIADDVGNAVWRVTAAR